MTHHDVSLTTAGLMLALALYVVVTVLRSEATPDERRKQYRMLLAGVALTSGLGTLLMTLSGG